MSFMEPEIHDKARPTLIEVTQAGFTAICDRFDKEGQAYFLTRASRVSGGDYWLFEVDGCPVGQVHLRLCPTYYIYAHAFRDLFAQSGE